MNNLHVDSSPRQESHSRQLSAAIIEKLLEVAPGASRRKMADGCHLIGRRSGMM